MTFSNFHIVKVLFFINLPSIVQSLTADEYYGKLAREAPFCVDKNNQNVQRFEGVFEHYEKASQSPVHVATTPDIPDVEEEEHINTNADGVIPKHKPSYEHKYKHVKMTFNRMNPTPVPSKQQLFNLRQWLHIHIHSPKPLQGLYVQSFSAPLGLPFGEFRTDFNCFDCMSANRPYHTSHHKMDLVPCRFRSYHSYKHPHVVVIGGKESVSNFHDAHFHFNWEEGTCQEAPLMQFLVIAVTDFNEGKDGFDVFYSQVINNTIPDSIDGVAYPFYIDFDGKMACHGPSEHISPMWSANMIRSYAPLNSRPYKIQHSRIIYNKDYDDCVASGGTGGDGNYQCTPGPFKCTKADNSSMTVTNFRAMIQERITFYSSDNSEVCPSCLDKEATNKTAISRRTTHDEPIYSLDGGDEYDDEELNKVFNTLPRNNDLKLENASIIEQEFWKNSNRTFEMIRRVHGTLMIFGWITCPILGFYVARYYKETGHGEQGVSCCYTGGWLWGHIILSYLSLVTMWSGVGIMMVYDSPCDYTQDEDGENGHCSSAHHVPGIIAMAMFHLNFLTGWCRPIAPKCRTIYIVIHVLLGYGSFLAAVISVCFVVESISWQISASILMALGMFFLFNILSSNLQNRIDSKLRLEIPRTNCPVIEAIAVVENPPYGNLSCALLILFILIQITLFLWAVVSHTRD